jgi:hypothetical protein
MPVTAELIKRVPNPFPPGDRNAAWALGYANPSMPAVSVEGNAGKYAYWAARAEAYNPYTDLSQRRDFTTGYCDLTFVPKTKEQEQGQIARRSFVQSRSPMNFGYARYVGCR